MKTSINKRCPRCNTKQPITMAICPKCQLNFQKFNEATNKEAKNKIHAGESEQVLLRKGRPSDIKFSSLLLITIFLGFLGGHYYYVGRYKMGAFCSVFFLIGAVNAIINILNLSVGGDLWEIFAFLVLGWGVVLFIWIFDIANVLLNRFKIPVSRS